MNRLSNYWPLATALLLLGMAGFWGTTEISAHERKALEWADWAHYWHREATKVQARADELLRAQIGGPALLDSLGDGSHPVVACFDTTTGEWTGEAPADSYHVALWRQNQALLAQVAALQIAKEAPIDSYHVGLQRWYGRP